MIIIIGHVTPEELAQYNIEEYQSISKVCGINKNDIYDIYIMNTEINDFGLIKNTEIIIDELFITYKINCVFYKLNDASYLLNACLYYGVTVYSLNE